MAVPVRGADGDDGDLRPQRCHERPGRGRPAPVVRDLEDVDGAQATADENGIDLLLRVAREQEAPAPDRELEYDRDVVDLLAAVRRRGRHAPGVGPQHAKASVVDGEPVAAGETPARLALLVEQAGQGDVAGTWPGHPRLIEAPDAVPPEQPDEPRRVILVGVREDDHVETPVPGRYPGVEQSAQAVRVWTAVDEDAAARRALDEDGVTLAHVEDRDASPAVGPCRRDPSEGDEEARGEAEERE